MVDSTIPKTPSRWGMRIVIVLALTVGVPVGASILYTYSPADNTFYPGCFFNQVTGLHCPGCGATRCLHALLHLDIAQALAWNPLFVVALPFLLAGLGWLGYLLWTGRSMPGLAWPRWLIVALLLLVLGYGIARNIPCAPFSVLKPHKLE